MEQPQTYRRRIAKPLGLYIITVFDIIALGLVPLVSVLLLARREDVELPFVVVLIYVGLAFSVMGAAVWACIGDNAGRYLLLGLVTISSVLFIVNGAISVSDGGSTSIASVGLIIRATFWIVINWWYFNRKHVVAYFRQDSK